MSWTKEQAEKLKSYVDHRNYIVKCNFGRGINIVTELNIVDDYPIVFGINGEEDIHELDEYQIEDFTIYQPMENWQNESPRLY